MEREEFLSIAAEKAMKNQQAPRRVYSLIRSSIRDGSTATGAKLAEDSLSDSMSSSRNSVREALAQLAVDGLVNRSTRSGTVVIGSIRVVSMLGGTSRRADLEDDVVVTIIEEREVAMSPLLSARLEQDIEAVQMSEYLISINGAPFGLHTSYVTPGSESLLAARVNGTLRPGDHVNMADSFERLFKSKLSRTESFVEAVTCDRRSGSLLGLKEGAPMLLRERLLVGEDDVPRELSFTAFRADRAGFSHVIHHEPSSGGAVL